MLLTDDELPDSRRFQFFALCRDHHIDVVKLPNWVAMDDAQRSLDAELIVELPGDDDVLELAPEWSTCAFAVNDNAARAPISCDATQDGLDWDTTAVPAGNYVIRGYTFEPALNLWRPRRGVIQVNDGGEPLPVVSLMSPAVDVDVFQDDGYSLVGCMGGPEGTTVTLAWANIADLDVDEAADWHDIEELDAADCGFDVRFMPPDAAIQRALVFRATATGPDGTSWVNYAQGRAIVRDGPGMSDGTDVFPAPDLCEASLGVDPPQWCEPPAESGEDSGADGGDEGGGEGCGCRTRRDPMPLWLVALIVAFTRRRSGPDA